MTALKWEISLVVILLAVALIFTASGVAVGQAMVPVAAPPTGPAVSVPDQAELPPASNEIRDFPQLG